MFIGTLAEPVSGSVTNLTLSDKAKRPLEPGDPVLVDDVKAQVYGSVLRGDTALKIEGVALEAEAGTAVSLLPYDYAAQAATNRATDKLQRGSLYFSVVPDGTSVSAANGAAEGKRRDALVPLAGRVAGQRTFFRRRRRLCDPRRGRGGLGQARRRGQPDARSLD